ncbi:hypothetical protein NLG97_g2588 [Lecanicillium saksenae]|uniref:Uncharacterized protein n=1 Tax=Lecanicillium saksenae TaxID=468837 RepID=A0ACC1R2C8_9HYPO|nr:hypothetical protein NLG97_g2588 [Lecanicillium saksenae]
MATLAADRHFWDPLADVFDFSLTFQESMLQIVPSIVGVALFPVFFFRFRNEPVYVRSSPMLWAKLMPCAALIVCQAVSVGLRKSAGADDTKTAMPAASLELLAVINLGIMVYVGHKHAIRSSGLIASYVLVTFLFDIVKSRAFFLRSGLQALAGIATATAALRLCLLILEEVSKKNILIDEKVREATGPEATSGFFTRLFFIFLNRMLVTGFFQELQNPDIVKLDADFDSERLHAQLRQHWERDEGEENEASSRYRLILACFYAFKWDLFIIFIPRLANIGVSFAQPFLVEIVTRTAELDNEGRADEISAGQRGGMQGATLFIFVTLAVSKTATAHLSNRLATKVRGALVSQLMEKTHGLSEREAKKSSVLTHMSSDIENIASGLTNFIGIPFTIFEVGLGVYFLSRFIGVTCLSVLLPVLATNFGSFFLSKKTGPAMARWNAAIQVRISRTTEVLQQLPSIKMLGLGPVMREQIHRLRIKEMDISRPYRFFMMFLNILQEFADVGTPVVVVAFAFFYKGFDRKITPSLVFPTLTVITLIQGPTITALGAYTDVATMLACFDRIQQFLLLPERQDSRVKWDPAAPPGTFEPRPIHYGSTVMRARQPAQSPNGIIQFVNASIAPVEMEGSLLSEVNFSLLRGSVSGVVGRTGSGKSTFFKSILGETRNDSGYVYTDQVSIAYCGPNHWLKDSSIRSNIIGCLPFDAVRYEISISVCQLEHDLSQLPGGDEFRVGPNGLNLSGGQRQRVSIARAVFARCDITILDDSFSSLDRRTATAILFGLCGSEGILRTSGSTVLLSTYIPEFMDVSDQLIHIDDEGHLSLESRPAQGSVRSQAITNYLNSARPCVSEDSEDKEKSSLQRFWNTGDKESYGTEEAYGRRKGNWRLYMILINSVGKLKSLGLAGLALILSISEFLPEIYMRKWSEEGPENGEYYIGYLVLALFSCGVIAVAYWVLFTVFAVQSAVNLHEQILDVTMRATLGFLTSTKTGNLLNRFSQDANLFSKVLPGFLFRTLYMFFGSLTLIGIILSSAAYMLAVFPFLLAAIYFVQAFYLRTSRQMRHIDIEEKAPLYTFFCETAEGLLHIRAFGWLAKNMATGYQLLNRSQQPYYLMLCIQQWLGLVLGLVTSAVAFIMVTIAVWAKHGTSGPAIGLSFLSVLNFQRTLVLLLESWTGSETSVAALGRLEIFCKRTPQEPRPPLPEDVPPDWAPDGDVDFSSASARYHPSEEVPPQIRDLSLAIVPGEKVGLIGRTGSGKSSLLLTILGFLYYQGKVELDGIDVKTLDADFLRSRIITITQDPVILNETVRKNLLPFTINDSEEMTDEKRAERDALDVELTNVLRRLNLWDILRDKGGLDAILPEVGYSKGELQVFSIARAIIRRYESASNLVLIDEAASNLDLVRADDTQEVLREAFADCTVITVAHREEALQAVDFTVVLEGGSMLTLGEAQAAASRLFSSVA